MASALQILHEVRENDLARQQNAATQRKLYRTDSDRERDESLYVSSQRGGNSIEIEGVVHHGGGNVATSINKAGLPPSTTTRPQSARAPVILSPDVTKGSIPRLEEDRLAQSNRAVDPSLTGESIERSSSFGFKAEDVTI